MRILILLLTVLFATAIFAVMLMNYSETVTLRLWNDPEHEYRNIPLFIVLFGAVFAGFLFTGIVAVTEGMKTRLENARLFRKVRRLQQELDAIRTPALPLPEDVESTEAEGEAEIEEEGEQVPG